MRSHTLNHSVCPIWICIVTWILSLQCTMRLCVLHFGPLNSWDALATDIGGAIIRVELYKYLVNARLHATNHILLDQHTN